jgi:hypothetical protein
MRKGDLYGIRPHDVITIYQMPSLLLEASYINSHQVIYCPTPLFQYLIYILEMDIFIPDSKTIT